MSKLTQVSDFSRNCPQCNTIIFYSSKGNLNLSIKNNGLCRKCASFQRSVGEKNPFYGKHHSDSTKNLLKQVDRSYTQEKSFKEKSSLTLSKYWNDGKSFYNYWIENFGQEIADQKLKLFKEKQSINNSGDKNPMYGKPPTKGVGSGWSGWYKNWFFRSLLELSYVINYLDKNNLKWESAERKDLGMVYQDLFGKNKTYFADFLVEDFKLVEIKPIRLLNTPRVLAKKEAAFKFCATHNYNYEIITPEYLDKDMLISLYESGLIKFSNKSEQQFKKYHNL